MAKRNGGTPYDAPPLLAFMKLCFYLLTFGLFLERAEPTCNFNSDLNYRNHEDERSESAVSRGREHDRNEEVDSYSLSEVHIKSLDSGLYSCCVALGGELGVEISEQNDKCICRIAIDADEPVLAAGDALVCGVNAAAGEILDSGSELVLIEIYRKGDCGGGNFVVFVNLGGLEFDVLELGSEDIVEALGGEVNIDTAAETHAELADQILNLGVENTGIDCISDLRKELDNLGERRLRRGDSVDKIEHGNEDSADASHSSASI